MGVHTFANKPYNGGSASPTVGDPTLVDLIEGAFTGDDFLVFSTPAELTVNFPNKTLSGAEVTTLQAQYDVWDPGTPLDALRVEYKQDVDDHIAAQIEAGFPYADPNPPNNTYAFSLAHQPNFTGALADAAARLANSQAKGLPGLMWPDKLDQSVIALVTVEQIEDFCRAAFTYVQDLREDGGAAKLNIDTAADATAALAARDAFIDP